MASKIEIILNGFEEKVYEGSSIASLIKQFNETDPHLFVELNGRFVYAQKYGETIVREHDRVEFINPDLGG
jgi:thiamine biosynthesis protein ThiS